MVCILLITSYPHCSTTLAGPTNHRTLFVRDGLVRGLQPFGSCFLLHPLAMAGLSSDHGEIFVERQLKFALAHAAQSHLA